MCPTPTAVTKRCNQRLLFLFFYFLFFLFSKIDFMKKESQFRKKPNLYVSIEVKIKNGFISDVFLFLIS
jgi:hypothetical protein